MDRKMRDDEIRKWLKLMKMLESTDKTYKVNNDMKRISNQTYSIKGGQKV